MEEHKISVCRGARIGLLAEVLGKRSKVSVSSGDRSRTSVRAGVGGAYVWASRLVIEHRTRPASSTPTCPAAPLCCLALVFCLKHTHKHMPGEGGRTIEQNAMQGAIPHEPPHAPAAAQTCAPFRWTGSPPLPPAAVPPPSPPLRPPPGAPAPPPGAPALSAAPRLHAASCQLHPGAPAAPARCPRPPCAYQVNKAFG